MGMNLKFLNFKFDSDEAIASSFEQQAIYNRILELFILASVSCLSVKNKKGIDLRELCELLSSICRRSSLAVQPSRRWN